MPRVPIADSQPSPSATRHFLLPALPALVASAADERKRRTASALIWQQADWFGLVLPFILSKPLFIPIGHFLSAVATKMAVSAATVASLREIPNQLKNLRRKST